jgi:polysaccharide export outer membrane protein
MLAVAMMAALVGCRSMDLYHAPLHLPIQSPMEPPNEMAKVSLPAYRIEPPDLLILDVVRLVPRAPYRLDLFDVLRVRADPVLPWTDNFGKARTDFEATPRVELDGRIELGPRYGSVQVAGLTVEEARQAILEQFERIIRQPGVSVQVEVIAGAQALGGEYLVAPDGTINLRQYGRVHVAGKTIAEARTAIQQHLSQFLDSPEIWLDVRGYNSKVYYVITEGAGLGDNVLRVPVTGNETVLDALSQVGGLSQLSSKRIWIARPAPSAFGCEQILPVDWDAITRGAATATNYQIFPGDRIFVAEDNLVATNNFLIKLISPVERLLGVTSLGASTVRNTQTLGRAYNRLRSQ